MSSIPSIGSEIEQDSGVFPEGARDRLGDAQRMAVDLVTQ
jgi:hypothetical protein